MGSVHGGEAKQQGQNYTEERTMSNLLKYHQLLQPSWKATEEFKSRMIKILFEPDYFTSGILKK